MVKIMQNPIKMDDLGGNTPIFGNTHTLPPEWLMAWKMEFPWIYRFFLVYFLQKRKLAVV